MLYSRDLGQKWAHHRAILGRMGSFAGREYSVDIQASRNGASKNTDVLEFFVEARNLPDDRHISRFRHVCRSQSRVCDGEEGRISIVITVQFARAELNSFTRARSAMERFPTHFSSLNEENSSST